ncbi:MAG: NUDIX domain-containing protein [Acidobacteria bacterium]|nr:NUDIX domain-containing protein [Acidobacteriota bacterium]
MIEPSAVLTLIRGFDDPSDGATGKSFELIQTLLEHSPAPFSREQFIPGHITTSGLVVSPDSTRILILHHRRLDRWLLPGGHVEADDPSVEAASAREVLEETGVPVSGGVLAGADVHGIPGKRDEPYHLHHDLLFSFRAGTEDLRVSDESHAVAWCAPADFDRYAIPPNVRRAWERISARGPLPRTSA